MRIEVCRLNASVRPSLWPRSAGSYISIITLSFDYNNRDISSFPIIVIVSRSYFSVFSTCEYRIELNWIPINVIVSCTYFVSESIFTWVNMHALLLAVSRLLPYWFTRLFTFLLLLFFIFFFSVLYYCYDYWSHRLHY